LVVESEWWKFANSPRAFDKELEQKNPEASGPQGFFFFGLPRKPYDLFPIIMTSTAARTVQVDGTILLEIKVGTMVRAIQQNQV
jgi:hypothetical protein